MDQALLQTAAMPDGAEIVYRIQKGNGSKRIVLIHALAMNGAFWDDVAAALLPVGDVLVYDCRGHGASTKSPGPYSVEQFADDLAALMDHVGWNTATVAGASMGGCIALAFAGAYPQRLEGLGLIDTTAGYGPDAPVAWEERAQKAVAGGMGALLDFQLTRWVSQSFRDAKPASLDKAVEVFLAGDVAAYVETCRMLGQADNSDVLDGIKVSTAVIVGEEDYATPVAMAERLHHGITGSSLHVLAGVRHFTVLECPNLVAEKLRDAIGR